MLYAPYFVHASKEKVAIWLSYELIVFIYVSTRRMPTVKEIA